MDNLGWIECQSSENCPVTLSLAGERIQLPALGQLGPKSPTACFADEMTLAGVDRHGWLNLWDASSGKSLARADPLLHPVRFEAGFQVVIAGGWILGVNLDERRIQGYRFPYGEAEKVGSSGTRSRKQAMLSHDGKRMWLIDLATQEIEEIALQIEVVEWNELEGNEQRVMREMINLPVLIESVAIDGDRLSVVYKDYGNEQGDCTPTCVAVSNLHNQELLFQAVLGDRSFVTLRPGYRYQYLDVMDGTSIVLRRASFKSSTERILFEFPRCSSAVFNMAFASKGDILAALIGKQGSKEIVRNEVVIIDTVHRKLVQRSPLPATESSWLDKRIEFAPSSQRMAVCGTSAVYVLSIA